ncbi:MAG: tetratricopeptide repeat protein, partial [Gemmatimonadaceae bacterium]|nr:tetratricopeptide repeat protein [Gemmatimonadaceae bacterium]
MQNPRRYFVPLANEYRKANELDRAIALCREHLPSQPGHMSGHIVLARAYYEKGDIEAAREVFLTSVALDDENLIALRHLGDIARSRNELDDARQWYARVLDADPQNEEIERLLRTLSQPTAAIAAASVPIDAPHVQAGTVPSWPEPVLVEATVAEPQVPARVEPPASAPPSRVEPELSSLDDPTPPGLRAITTPGFGMSVASVTPALPHVPVRTLDTFDLSTLDAPHFDAPHADAPPLDTPTPADGIRVDDGVGFLFDDVEELTDPAATGGGLSLPPVGEADFSAGIETPTTPAGAIPPTADDSLLSKPGFGALASFASWRTAQDRETPSQAAPSVPPSEPPRSVTPAAIPAAADAGLFWASASADTAPTAPEFVTETMAALYAQQGFTQQAIDVYRALLLRTPGDAGLTARLAELESALASGGVDKALQDDADKALQFGNLDAWPEKPNEGGSALEDLYAASPPTSGRASDNDTFGGGWSAEKDAANDDWFAEAEAADAASDNAAGFDGIFGVTTDAFGQPVVPPFGREPASASGSSRPVASIELVFGSATIAPADEAAADMLLALASQMVGRLPKDAPTLPVPDILELPSAVAGDDATGASPAPLLSFDRFFSGSGSPPRQRIDTPVARSSTPTWPVQQAPVAPPSLSPTFGGVPVIPPPPASVTPSSWATFDQFVP